MRLAIWATGAALLAAVAGCTGSSGGPAGASPSAPGSPIARGAPGPFAHCPIVDSVDGTYAAVDYVDFVQAFGRQYLDSRVPTDISGSLRPGATRADLGRVVLRSRCSFSEFNDRTHKNPGEPHDGDTGFLPAGTPIYTVHGWSKHCRLAAEHDGRLHVYLALRAGTDHARPRYCALGHPL